MCAAQEEAAPDGAAPTCMKHPELRLHEWLKKALFPCDYTRVEAAGSGLPDVNVAHMGRSTWIELKVVTNGMVLLRKEQYAWGKRRAGHGERVNLIAWHEELNQLMIWHYDTGVEIEVYSKYLRVVNMPVWLGKRQDCLIKTILFPQ